VSRDPTDRFRFWRRTGTFAGLAALMSLAGSWISVPGTLVGAPGILLGAVAAGWILLAWDGFPIAALGFHGSGRAAAREAVLGSALGLTVALVAVGIMAGSGVVRWTGQGGEGILKSAFLSLWFFAVPAAAEEALFRGYPLQAAARSWGPLPALLVTSLAFAALHGTNPEVSPFALLNIAAAGLFLGMIYLRTGSLWWATGAHLGWNWAHGFAADLPVSGLDLVDNPALRPIVRGPDWLSGGAFGPEASLAGTAALLAGAVWCWRTRRLGVSPALEEKETLAPLLKGPRGI
jgi:membrane protease YdiL (CAAX protease family)